MRSGWVRGCGGPPGARRLRPSRDATGSPLLSLALPDFGQGLDHALVLRRSHLYQVLHLPVPGRDRPPVATALAERDLDSFRRRCAGRVRAGGAWRRG